MSRTASEVAAGDIFGIPAHEKALSVSGSDTRFNGLSTLSWLGVGMAATVGGLLVKRALLSRDTRDS